MTQLVSLHFDRKWSLAEEADGNVVRHFPAGLVVQLEREPAAMAIAEGVARLMSPLDDEMQAMVDGYTALLELMAAGLSFDEAVAHLEAAAAETQDDDTGDDADEAAAADPAPAPAKPKPKARKKAAAG